MRRLTLILSDLYLPGDATSGEIPRLHELPTLERWLRFADRPARIADWRGWLAGELGATALAEQPIAHLQAQAAGVDVAGAWMATPVRLEARLDHVRMAGRGILRLTPAESRELCREFDATFGPDHALTSAGERALLLRGGPAEDLRTLDPARLLDADIAPALPAGPASGALRRLGAEIEMWLPGTRTNAARQRAGQPAITALWLWGGGRVRTRAADTFDGAFRLHGGDPYLFSLASLAAQSVQPAPASFSGLGEISRTYVELAPISGTAGESLPAIEASWIVPAAAALRGGSLDSLTLVTNDRVFRASPAARFRWWRRSRHWLDALKA